MLCGRLRTYTFWSVSEIPRFLALSVLLYNILSLTSINLATLCHTNTIFIVLWYIFRRVINQNGVQNNLKALLIREKKFKICIFFDWSQGLLFSAKAVRGWHCSWIIGAEKGNHKFPSSGKNSLYCLHDGWPSAPDTKYSVLPLNGNIFFVAIIHDI